ncbi:hypothetical protein D9M72_456540 [compost metagenome]
MEAGDGVAVAAGAAVAAFGPAHQRGKRDAVLLQPGAFLPGGELDVRAAPLLRPLVLRKRAAQPVPLGRTLPVLPCQLEGILHAQAPLHGGVHQEQPAEGPEGLAAEVGCVLLVQDRHPLAGPSQLVAGHQPGQPAADDDDIRVHQKTALVEG